METERDGTMTPKGAETVSTPAPAASIKKSASQAKLNRSAKPSREGLEALMNTAWEANKSGTALFEFAGETPPTAPSGAPSLRLVGPVHVLDSLSKEGSKKKEDKWLLKANNRWGTAKGAESRAESRAGGGAENSFTANVGVWGVFDGHGGKQAATYASHALYKYTAEFVASAPEAKATADGISSPLSFGIPEKSDNHPALYAPGFTRQLTKPGVLETFGLQLEYMKRLPSAVHAAFLKADEQARKQFQQGGGTTATMAFLCGWQLLVASVGDSQAYLDTGSEVLSVSANHRLDDNESERARIEGLGGEVASSTVNGKPAGPLRVWPGGLAMSRTIGDVEAGLLCLAEAEVVQVTIPKDGARLIIGSDGLWDAVHPKTAAHHTREMTAGEASHKLLSMAIKKDHLKDDVTVVVVDVMPPGCTDKVPPGLRLHSPRATPGAKGGQAEPMHLARVWRPLEDVGCLKWAEEELMRRVDEYAAWRRQEEDREAVIRRQKEMATKAALGDKGGEERAAAAGGADAPTGGKKMPTKTKKRGSKKSLLDELSNLTLDPEAFDDDWEVVGGGGGGGPATVTDKKKGGGRGMPRTNATGKPKKHSHADRGAEAGMSQQAARPQDKAKNKNKAAVESASDGDIAKKKKRPPRNRKNPAGSGHRNGANGTTRSNGTNGANGKPPAA